MERLLNFFRPFLGRPRKVEPKSLEQAQAVGSKFNFNAIVRPAYAFPGTGPFKATNQKEFEEAVKQGIASSPTSEILIEESL